LFVGECLLIGVPPQISTKYSFGLAISGLQIKAAKESIHFFSIMDRILAVKGGEDGDIRSRSTSFSGRFGDFSDRDVGSLKFKPATAGNYAPESKPPKAPLQAARYCRRLRVGRC
jgi:hypothetical protein